VLSDNSKETQIPSLSKVTETIGQLGEELAFVSPNQDAGLLPINRFVMDLEELPERELPLSATAGLKVAREWLDQVLDGPGKFTEESIRNFNGWHTWMTSVLLAWERGTTMPAWPDGWDADHPTAAEAETTNTAATPSPSGGEESSIHLNLAADLEFLREFHGESVELLQDIEQGILVLEDNPADAATVDSIFRAFHTFKGGAGFLHLESLRDLAHDLESLLDAVRRSELHVTSEIINLILAGADALKHFTREIGAQIQGVNPGAPILVPTQPPPRTSALTSSVTRRLKCCRLQRRNCLIRRPRRSSVRPRQACLGSRS
jgi:two-component system chemotaxis sensor kinase CheA